MIIVTEPTATEEQIEQILARIDEFGLEARVTREGSRVIVGVLGPEPMIREKPLAAMPGVESIIPVLKPYKLAAREARSTASTVDICGLSIGGDSAVALICGPCSVESREQMLSIARTLKDSGARMLRGGAFKPRTSPYSFQGLREEGLRFLAEARNETGLPVITEVMDARDLPIVERYADCLQIGARNMQNFSLLRRAGRSSLPVLLKRGLAATLDEWLLAAEYVMAEGNHNVVLCERGIRTFAQHSRNTLDLAAIPAVRRVSHLPVVIDPSHGTGKNYMVAPLARAGTAVGADGLLIEVHDQPERALSDGAQALTLAQYDRLVDEVRAIYEVIAPAAVG